MSHIHIYICLYIERERDLKKAFDTVDHGILLQKLHHYGIQGIINDWFHSYLYGRTQSTQISTHCTVILKRVLITLHLLRNLSHT